MGLVSKTKTTLAGVADASTSVIETTGWATVALIAVTAVSVLALFAAVVALGRTHG